MRNGIPFSLEFGWEKVVICPVWNLTVATVMKAEEVPPVPPVTGIVPPVEAHFPLEGPSLSMLLTLGLVLLMIFILRKREGERINILAKRESH